MKRLINIDALTRPTIQAMQAYRSARSEFVASDREMILLDANENPFETGLNRYPDPMQTELKERLAKVKAVAPSHIFLGNGSDELINLLMVAFCEPKEDEILLVPPTFGMYQVSANLNGVACIEVPLISGFQLNVSEILAQATDRTKMIFIPTPNNPTGNRFPMKNIKAIVAGFPGLVVVDEAYIDFGGESAVALIDSYTNLLVVHTLSKSRSLAGMRIGYGMGSAELIEGLERIKNSFNPFPLGQLQIAAAIASFEDQDYFQQTCQRIISSREQVSEQLQNLGFEVLPSQANFVFARHSNRPAQELSLALREQGLIVRHFKKPRIDEFLRITIGTEQQNELLIAALESIVGS